MCDALVSRDLDVAAAHVGEAWQQLRGKSIFLTGGTGFVGKWMLATLAHARARFQLDCHITLLSRHPQHFTDHWSNFFDGSWMHLWKGDLKDFHFPTSRYEFVIHAGGDVVQIAGHDDLAKTAVIGTDRVLQFANQCGTTHFHFVSSGAVYGQQPWDLPMISEEQSWMQSVPSDSYTEGKRVAEALVQEPTRNQNFKVTISRCFTTVGPLLPLSSRFVIGNLIRDALAGGDLCLVGDGTAVRSYLYAADMAGWLWRIALSAKTSAIYNVGSSDAITILQLAHRVANLIRPTLAIRLGKVGANSSRYVPNISKVHRELGLVPTIDLDESIRRTAMYYDQSLHTT